MSARGLSEPLLPVGTGRAEGQEIPHTHGEAWQAATPPSTVSDLFLCRRLWRLVMLFRPWQTLFLAGLSIAEALVVAQVGKVAGSYYAILVDFDPGAFLATTLHSAVLYAACAVLSGVGTALQRRLALSWRQRLTATLHAAYCAGAAFAGLRLDNPDQRATRDARALCDDLAAVARVAVSIPFRGAYYAALTAGYLGWRGLAVAAAYFICATLLQWSVAVPLARLVYAQESAEGDLRTAHARLRALRHDAALAGRGGDGHYGAEAEALGAAAAAALGAQARLVPRQAALEVSTKAVDYGGALLTYTAVAVAVFSGTGPRGGDPGDTARFVSNAAFATMALVYTFTELMDKLNTYARLPGLLARVGELLEELESGAPSIERSDTAGSHSQLSPWRVYGPAPASLSLSAWVGEAPARDPALRFASSSEPEAELSVHCLPRGSAMHARARAVFPQAPDVGALLACLTLQPMAHESRDGSELDAALARFLAWVHAVHVELVPRGRWVDAVDPATGRALLGRPGSKPWAEAEAARHLLGYGVAQGVSSCALLVHPRLGSKVFPATLLTDAPWAELEPALRLLPAPGAASPPPLPSPPPPPLLELEGLSLRTPDGRWAARDLALRLAPGRGVLLAGPNGAGKSTLLRALAGLAPLAAGRVAFEPGARVAWLPQRPLAAPGAALWQHLAYPARGPRPTEAAAGAALAAVGLRRLMAHPGCLDAPPPDGLSPGELQRLAFARLLLCPPALALLDEPTSALGAGAAAEVYAALAAAGVTCLSVGQDVPHLRAAHAAVLKLVGGDGAWTLEGGDDVAP
uniref:ABC transporter domain-containing protein n=2 Tax=Auxenochlorella protothecoides TaxID=3075 RepID=A0A1D1ZUR4_AUXPR